MARTSQTQRSEENIHGSQTEEHEAPSTLHKLHKEQLCVPAMALHSGHGEPGIVHLQSHHF